MTLFGRPDLETFKVGRFYVHDHTDTVVEFIGTAVSGHEDVGIFKAIDGDDCFIADQESYNSGQMYEPSGDRLDEERETEGDT